MTSLNQIHLDAIAKAATAKREMVCLRSDGAEIERRKVGSFARMSMQAAADHKAADKARAELGAELDRVQFVGPRMNVTLLFDKNGRSYSDFKL